ncbi:MULTISPECIES: DUF2537 domain-containing protein [unclassified Gordonia (in: high G+C Gram-positive bacteria)]|uniref:DUF2537 domain-containing protein n=1 Tax=unclassified Gordonia (in: high G+C Gram-positive bacteria) TaxID=2657482 RepID=UPI001F1122FF|nr:DUF2537 domain-containing protein [Gordonia sp. ABSL49_1]MCH5643179.1 DUF2537 domain-containing protein [Gordonia sp. ABSL49_1]
MTGGAEHPAEPTPWLFGLIVAVACAVFATLVLIGLYDLVGNAQRWLGLVAVAVVAGGLGWTLWELRFRAVLRWIVWGLLLGMLAGAASSVALFAVGR